MQRRRRSIPSRNLPNKKTISNWSSHWFLCTCFFFCFSACVHAHPEKLSKMCFFCFLYDDFSMYCIYTYICIYTRGLRLFHMPAMSQLSPLVLGDGASHHIQCALCIFKFSKTLCRCIRHLDIPEPMHTLAPTEITFNIVGIYIHMYGGCHEEIGKVLQLKQHKHMLEIITTKPFPIPGLKMRRKT